MAVGPFSISEVNQLVQHSPQIACPHLLTRTRIDKGPLTTEQQTGEHTRTRSQMPRSHTEKETYAIEKYSLDVRVSVQEKHTPAGNPLAGAPGPPERNTHPEKKKTQCIHSCDENNKINHTPKIQDRSKRARFNKGSTYLCNRTFGEPFQSRSSNRQ
jgi:hypothetical protein